jgi:hypothetical protein
MHPHLSRTLPNTSASSHHRIGIRHSVAGERAAQAFDAQCRQTSMTPAMPGA